MSSLALHRLSTRNRTCYKQPYWDDDDNDNDPNPWIIAIGVLSLIIVLIAMGTCKH